MILLIMGVAGSGKTTFGMELAIQLGWQFADADDFHPAENIKKLESGKTLTETDRRPWLFALRQQIDKWSEDKTNGIMACSALKKDYREILIPEQAQILIIYLKGDFSLIRDRLRKRKDHFFNPAGLENQFEILEEPEDALVLDISNSINDNIQVIKEYLKVN